MPTSFLQLAVVIALLSGPASAQMPPLTTEPALRTSGAQQLRGADIKQRLLGNTQYQWLLKDQAPARKGLVYPIYLKDERTRRQKNATGQVYEALWWIDGDLKCFEQKVVNIGHQCYSLWQSGPTLYECLQSSGECFIAVSVKAGNPENY